MKRIAFLLATVLGAAVLAASALAQDTAPAAAPSTQAAQAAAPAQAAGNAETGRKLWVSYGCWQCHGYQGQGGAAGPRLSARPLPYAGFARYVRHPTNQMPPYTEKVLPETDLQHIHRFVTSVPAPPAAATIPILK